MEYREQVPVMLRKLRGTPTVESENRGPAHGVRPPMCASFPYGLIEQFGSKNKLYKICLDHRSIG